MKRFYKNVETAPAADGGWTVTLDGKPIRTPRKTPFRAPTAAMAAAAAAEWAAQKDQVDPALMPVTRGVNSALDRAIPEFDGVVEMIAAYGESDLLSYRAEGPEALVARQAAAWDPLLAKAEAVYGARLAVTAGIVHVSQDAAALARLKDAVADFDPFALTGLYDLVALSGSLVIGLLTARGDLSAAEGWGLSRVDEIWQAEQWGDDDDALRLAVRKAQEFAEAARFIELARADADEG